MSLVSKKRLQKIAWCLVIGVGFELITAASALACPDCAFPTARGKWTRIEGSYEIDIQELKNQSGGNQVRVYIRDAETGRILARGTKSLRGNARRLQVAMTDNDGNQMQAEINLPTDESDAVEVNVH